MRKIPSIIFTLLFVLASFSIAQKSFAFSSVWKASKNGKHLFIGGTIHVLSPEDYPLPCEFDAAYSVSDSLVFETDIKRLTDANLAFDLISQGTYPFGEELNTKIKSSTLQNLTVYLNEELGLPSAGFMKYKPGMLLSFITIAELNRLGIDAEGVDIYFSKLATRDNKPVSFFEQPQEQIDFIANLGIGNEDKFINYIIESSQKLGTQYSEMIKNWRSGELNKLAKSIEFKRLQIEFPKVFDTLLVNRNEKWLQEIDQLIQSHEVEYVLVGGAHLIEKEGLIERLKSKGYQLDQLSCTYN